jgi:16S rRNA (guanine527-N7)-methyltransferase
LPGLFYRRPVSTPVSAATAARRERLLHAADRLGIVLEDSGVERLLAFLGVLERWNATYNLTAVRDPDAMLTQHIIDSLAVAGPLARELATGGRRILDVGSGGGLPGVVIAVTRPDDAVVCVDAVGKKVAFVRQAALELGLSNLSAEHARIERLQSAPFDLITARAFAALPEFIRLTRRHRLASGVWMAMKGRRPDDEIAALPADIEVFHVEPLAIPDLAAERCLVWMRHRN